MGAFTASGRQDHRVAKTLFGTDIGPDFSLQWVYNNFIMICRNSETHIDCLKEVKMPQLLDYIQLLFIQLDSVNVQTAWFSAATLACRPLNLPLIAGVFSKIAHDNSECQCYRLQGMSSILQTLLEPCGLDLARSARIAQLVYRAQCIWRSVNWSTRPSLAVESRETE